MIRKLCSNFFEKSNKHTGICIYDRSFHLLSAFSLLREGGYHDGPGDILAKSSRGHENGFSLIPLRFIFPLLKALLVISRNRLYLPYQSREIRKEKGDGGGVEIHTHFWLLSSGLSGRSSQRSGEGGEEMCILCARFI